MNAPHEEFLKSRQTGLGGSDIVMIETEIDKFVFDCQDGGTVAVCFRVVAHPMPEELGRLCEMIQQEVTISLEPPENDNA